METVGVYLRKERESKNLSLREVARLTKISELYLDCIEKDDYEKIPKGPYVKGYISSYSRMIGVDTQQALALYDSANEKKEQADAPQVDIAPATGWKVALANALTSLVEWANQSKERFQHTTAKAIDATAPPNATPSLSGKENVSTDDARSDEPIPGAADTIDDNRESSVLIHFSKFAPPSQVSHGIDHAPGPAPKTDRISSKSKIIPIHHKVIDFFKAVGIGFLSTFSDGALKGWPRPSLNVLVALVVLLLGATILVFSGIGVYHVFFFDKQVTVTTGTAPSPPPSTSSQWAIPHKTSRFEKPDTVPLVTPIAPEPPANPPAQPVRQSEPTSPVVDQNSQKPVKSKETAAVPDEKVTQPAEANIKVLKAAICTSIKDRMPDGVASVFPFSAGRVYVWSHVQTEHYPTTIRHIYYHEGQIVNRVKLSVRAPFWRTWSLKSIDKDRYRGHWRVDITDDNDQLLRRLYFEID